MSGVHNSAFESSENLNKPNENEYRLELQQKPFRDDQNSVPNNTSVEQVEENSQIFKVLTNVILHFILISYFAYVTYYFITNDTCEKNCKLTLCSPYGMLLVLYGSVYLGLLYYKIIKPSVGSELNQLLIRPLCDIVKELLSTITAKLVAFVIILTIFLIFIFYETYSDFKRLRALIAIVVFISIGFLISNDHKRINWRPVVCGAIFQFFLGVLFIRWPVGRDIFHCFGDKISQLLSFGKEGAAFVYGNYLVYDLHVFAFAILPTIIFASLFISVCYYLGVIQHVLMNLGWILQSVMGTTVCESVVAAGNIFLGLSECPLLIRPYIKHLTHSEIHAIAASGFSTVSGSVMIAYISFGAEPAHLITASVMAAPASLFFAKLIYPETEESKTSSKNIQLEKSTDASVLDAASNGASQAIPLLLNIIANLVGFVALVAFADSMLLWMTSLMGFDNINIQYILGKVFMPISWLIGVDWKDCEAVGNIIGMKTVVNEFIAFKKLGEYKAAGDISMRSSAIATFAICSFANPGSIGIMIGSLSALCEEKKSAVTKVAFRAFISACFVSLCTASIAGLLMTDDMLFGN